MRLNPLLLLIIFSLIVPPVLAQDTAENPYTLEERCLPEVAPPPADWTYSGTLLMSGYAGIHAMQADWETPRIEAFFRRNRLGIPQNGGQISPNGEWYAVPVGETWVEPSFNQYWDIRGLNIYSLVNERELNISLTEYYEGFGIHMGISAWSSEIVRWVDDESLLIGSLLIRPFGEEIEVEEASVSAFFSPGLEFEPSPDWSRIYGRIQSEELYMGIFEPEAPDIAIAYLQASAIAWQHDSSAFLAEQWEDEMGRLTLYDKDGRFIENLFYSEGGRFVINNMSSGRNGQAWSFDNRYFAFIHWLGETWESQLVLLDRENRLAINTCWHPVSQAVWLANEHQFAILLEAPENLRLVIVDIDNWTAYEVARHSGIATPNMIAWRPNP